MNQSKLVRTLSKLTASQWTAFGKFLRSPYYNQQASVVELANYLRACSPDWAARRLQREVVFQACYPSIPFNWQLLKDTSSALLKLLRQFLVLEEIRDQPELEQSLLIRGAMKNGMKEVWKRQLQRLEASKESSPYLTPHHLQVLEQHKNITLGSRQRSQAYRVLERQVHGLDHWYWKERLRLAVEAISVAQVLRQEVAKEVLVPLSAVPEYFTQQSGIVPYYLIMQLLQSQYPRSDVFFRQLLALLEQNHFPDNSEQEIYSFYVYGLNYCTARINGGDADYYAALFSIFQLLDQHGRLIQNEQLSQWTFLNVVATACNLHKFEWAGSFIKQYYTYIPGAHRHNAFHYCNALLHFYQTQYDPAIEHLLEVSGSDDPYYELNGRILQLRIFFEKREWLLVESLLDRVRIYLLRNKVLAPKRRKEVQLFLKNTRQLMLLVQSDAPQKDSFRDFTEKLEGPQAILHRSWLMDMAEREMF